MPIPLVKAAYRHLVNSGVPAQLKTAGLLGGDPAGQPFPLWVFSSDLSGDPFRNVEGTGKCAISLFSFDTWSPTSDMHSNRYPRLYLAIFADVTRDSAGNPTGGHDAEDKVDTIYREVRPLFHDPANKVHKFDNFLVHSTREGQPLSMMNIPDGDGAVRGLAAFHLSIN